MSKLWPDACAAQGWNIHDRDLRLIVCSIAVSCDVRNIHEFHHWLADGVPLERQLASTNDLDSNNDFTKVKALLLMLADNLGGPDAEAANKTRQKRHLVLKLMGELAKYPSNKPMGAEGAEAYVAAIMRDKFRRTALEDLNDTPIEIRDRVTGKYRKIPSQLDQLLITLTRCVRKYERI